MMYLIVVLNTIGSSFASYFLKKTTGTNIPELLKDKYLYLGGGLYCCVSLMTVWLLQRMPYTVVIPIGALAFVWTMLISRQFLGERISSQKVIGVAFIMAGVLCVAL